MRASAAKIAVAVVVAAVHVLLLWLLPREKHARSISESHAMSLVFIEDQSRMPPPAIVPRANPLRPLRPLNVLPLPPISLPVPSQDSSSTTITLPDWSSQAHDAAAHIVERQNAASQRPLDHLNQPTPEKLKPGIFATELHRAHMVERYDQGSERYWVSDHCYFDVDRMPSGPADGVAGPRLRLPRCKPSPGPRNTDLFKDLKPEALKHVPSPAR